ncbi:hypothetical protein MMF93_00160 [Streptomyces tubbatahanensis]|uniref:Uncharacterized protein n=1 Tax=Streptomyces tubbatahanensis TaxID=2923272 RepID=A0ABY3XKW1_9ACTN|nr:hypothetical protein [Streptomyces tubbatahanensis]UNS95048.1 hypothetical protein MMF93_00160 [Streptomyces tubbatahanensis]
MGVPRLKDLSPLARQQHVDRSAGTSGDSTATSNNRTRRSARRSADFQSNNSVL